MRMAHDPQNSPLYNVLPNQNLIMSGHFAVFFRGDDFARSRTRHQHRLFSQLRPERGQTFLNIGCGVGTAAFELAHFIEGVYVVGVDSNPEKIKEAIDACKQKRLSKRVSFILVADPCWTNLRDALPNRSFDGIFAHESLKSAPSFGEIYRDLGSLLRVGGKLAVYEWCWTNEIDPANVDHCRIAEKLEDSMGIPRRSVADRSLNGALCALQQANVSLLTCEDLAAIEPASIPWFAYLFLALHDPKAKWASYAGQNFGAFGGITQNAAWILSEAGLLKIFTPMLMIVGQRNAKEDVQAA